MKESIKEISKLLSEKDIRPSHQRIKILEYLMDNRIHPTVDMIYNELHEEIPTLSKTTVYNTLNLFDEVDLVTTLSIDDNEARYDIVTENHGHFICKECSEIYDFPIDMNSLFGNQLNDFNIQEKHVYFNGICPRCSK
ncbi:Fur family transcriptional regulator [Tissierella sp. Yu-01]|uniref:Fur family transcriptional regulator n=1 Tax=Tissierella sp. Yu-01 TaxID=3035694 RepID=UPI00240D2656|nr:Fur family transcriptional regulator [Tissierella sp. Yu-01]WFA08962.1 Fur family transcriptional regulator [Tissierella sp. Yu-01]